MLLLLYPQAGGDAMEYLQVARNIVLNGCVSLSDPTTGECLADWGGNQLPGYPIFISAVWSVMGDSLTSIRVGQSIIYVCAVLYLMRAIVRMTSSRRIGVAVGIIVSLSPIALPWARYILTETLALAITLWLFAELIESMHEKCLRVIPISLCLVAGVFVRIDLFSLCLPVMAAGFVIHPPINAMKKGLIISLIMLIPLSAWSVRSASLGLGWLPPLVKVDGGTRIPSGYLEWGSTWSKNEYEKSLWLFPVLSRQYQRVWIPEFAYDSQAEHGIIQALLSELAQIDHSEFPEHIDQGFAKVAEMRKARDPMRQHLWLPLQRSVYMWANVMTSGGFPGLAEMMEDSHEHKLRQVVDEGPEALVNLIREYPLLAFFKGMSGGYRLLLIVLTAYLAVNLIFRQNSASPLFWFAFLFAIGRTWVFSMTYNTSTRYIVEAAIALEVSVALVLLLMFSRRQKRYGKSE